MTEFAVARPDHRGQPRFFTGRYNMRGPIPLPVSTGNPDAAKPYGDTAIAQFVCTFLNVTAGAARWAIVPLPEARK